MAEQITQFKGEYAYLSNFYPSPVIRSEITYPTIEHFFQAHKTLWIGERLYIAGLPSPGEAKHAGRTTDLRNDWEEVKENVMFTGVMLKFLTHESLAIKLLSTRGTYLVEGNHWGDRVWGATWDDEQGWVGKNRLGLVLMKARDLLKEVHA